MTETTASADARARVVGVITAALPEVIDCDAAALTEQSRLFEELGLDSTGVFELLLRLEEGLDVEFDTDNLEMRHFSTVGSLATFIQTELG